MLRHFVTKATDASSPTVAGPTRADAADGTLLFHFGSTDTIPAVRTERPVIVGVTVNAAVVLKAARYLHALRELPDTVELDAVASHEVSERVAQASAELATRVAEAFLPSREGASWHLLVADEDGIARWTRDARGLEGRSLASLVSQACELVFPRAPHIRNEMLGRHTLTSQGAKARRELMLAMIDASTKQYLGIEGYGPERAMYSGVLEFLGLHRPTLSHGDDDALVVFGYSEPDASSSLFPAWTAMREQLQSATATPIRLNLVFDQLEAPPFGVRPGVIPIIVLTALILGSQEFALFEDGTYQTRLTGALVERMLKNPERFAVKAMGTQAGVRKAVINEIAQELGTRVPIIALQNTRNVAPLAVTRDLLDRARTLSSYAERTQQLSAPAKAVRVALKTAREPDTLLFNDLPIALGLPPIPVKGRADEATTRSYASSLKSALTEIAGVDHKLRAQVIDAIADAFHLPVKLPALRKQLAAHTRHLARVSLVEPRLRGVIDLAQDATLADDEWLDPFVVRIVNRGLSEWRDGDITTFTNEVRAVARAIERIAHLHQPITHEQNDDAFSTRVVTLTHPDGREHHTVIHVSDTDYNTASTIAADVVAVARKRLGRHGERILLALLAETVLAERDTDTDATPRQRKKPSR
jgi:hypothetical protein